MLARVKRIQGLDLGGMGFRFGFQLEPLGKAGGATLAQAFAEVVDQSGGDVALPTPQLSERISVRLVPLPVRLRAFKLANPMERAL
jgi:hypothetical protein